MSVRVGNDFPVISLTAVTSKPSADGQQTTRMDDLRVIAEQVNAAFQKTGLLLLADHGVPTDAIATLREAALHFFLDESPTTKATGTYRAPVPRGYSGNRKENFAILAGNQRPNDLVEKFRMGPYEYDAEDPYYTGTKDAQMMFYPNKWPQPDTYNLQAAMEAYYKHMERLMAVLLEIFEVCLDLPTGFFHDKVDKHTSILSVNHYPPVRKQVQKGQLRLAEHTDVDLFTILCPDWTDEYGCLQVNPPTESIWKTVPIIPGALIVNIGDCFNYWTQQRWLSTCHRVVVPDTREARSTSRIAIGYFVGANYDARIAELPTAPHGNSGSRWEKDQHDTTYVGWRKARIQRAMDQLAPKKN